MMFTGVHLDHETKRPVRWRVENSWGPEACSKVRLAPLRRHRRTGAHPSCRFVQGFLVMSDEWFTENVFQIVSLRSPELFKLYDTGRVTELPPYDPMGALA
jgi:bleomycin hydrolase